MKTLAEIVKGRSNPGILIFNMDMRLLYSNEEALDLVPEIGNLKTAGSPAIDIIHKLCKDIINNGPVNVGINSAIYHDNAGSSCSARAFLLGSAIESKPTSIMVMLERIIEKHEIDFQEVKSRFGLTGREAEVLVHICAGLKNKEISEKLFISEYTIKDHIKKLMYKIGASSRAEIIANIK